MGDTPNIRFEGFTDAWEQRKLSDAVEKLTGGASIAPDDYIEDGYRTIPKGAVNETGVANLSGCKYVSNVFFGKNISSKTSSGELVTSLRDLVPTAPNMGRIVRIIGSSEEFLMPQGVYSIKVKEKIDEDYLIAYSNSPVYRKIISAEKNGSTQVHIRNGEFLNIDFPMPCYEEQRLVGKTIRNLDHLITLHQRKCDEIKELKKFMLQKMFPKKGEKKPEIRFQGFTDAWEQRKLGDVIAELKSGLSRQLDNADIGLPVVRANNINDGKLDMENDVKYWYKDDPQGADTSNYLIHKNDILINFINSEAKMGTATIVDIEPARDTIYTTNILKMKADDTASDSLFLLYLTMTYHYCNYIKSITKPAVNQASFTTVDYKNYTFLIPSLAEQKIIGEYFSKLDHLITLHQRKCDEIKELKKYMLQNMFPQKG